MAPPDETSVKEVPALTKDAEVEKADEHKHAEEEDVPTLRSPNLDVIGVKNVNQEVNQGVNQELNQEVNRKVNRKFNQEVNRNVRKRLPYTKWSEKEEEIVRDIIDNHKSNPETSRMTLGELDIYSVKKLAEAGFIRTASAVSFVRGKQHCKFDYSKVCDLVANMPESIRAMEAREDSEKSATVARESIRVMEAGENSQKSATVARESIRVMEAGENSQKSATVASEPFRRRSTVPFQSATSLQEYDTLSKMKNSQFALNGKRIYESYNGDPAVDSANATNAAAAAAAARKPQAQACSMATNGAFNSVTNQQGFQTTSGSKSCEVRKRQSEMGLKMPPASKRMSVTNNSKETPVAIRNDSPLGQPQSESDRVEQARIEKVRAELAGIKAVFLECFRAKHWSEMIVGEYDFRLKEAADEAADMAAEYDSRRKEAADKAAEYDSRRKEAANKAAEYNSRRKEAADKAADYTKQASENVDKMLELQKLNPEFENYDSF
ncbi:uncharacterized protein EAE98_004243 [Botrytis deweyae]|uniref:Myb-like domain-containing protein n=1 Tax=Botrytis deweyae TaxID=2478750 RepID=A0ABQ7IQC0_9HELO|nr:uncharacterized protein EAE98_004243 [Botrytis deweyae]KAF7931507.1 hypothetical protein EAE98_004243 [Botrytis deweyae]